MKLSQLGKYSFFLALLFSCQSVMAQFAVSGKVVDEDELPLIGVSILEKGSSRGTITDIDGNFTLDIPVESAVLVFSYTGFSSQEVTVSSANPSLDVMMAEDIARLEEVVVSGLASAVKRSNSGNAVSTVSGEELTGKTSPQTLDNALFGKVAGVQMSANSGAPGGGVSMQLRGVATLGAGSSQPLFIVDGVYVDNSTIRTGRTQVSGASGGQNAATQDDGANRIADLNPDDIEKIEVLKGPSAAAIYGTRANAGVVIITTKRGKAGQTNIRLSQDIGIAQGQNFQNFGIWDRSRTETFNADLLPQFEAAEAENRNTDWEDFFYGETGVLSNTQLSVSGGTEKTQFYVSGGVQAETGIIKNTGFDRYSIRANIDHRLFSKVKLSLSTSYNKTDNDRGFTGNQNNTGGSIGYNIAYTPSFANLFPDRNGNYPTNTFFNDNPIAIRDLGVNNQVVDRFITAANLDIDLFQGTSSFLKLKINGGADYLSGNSLVYFPEVLQHQQATANPGDVMWGKQDIFNTNIQAFLIYNSNFGNNITSNTSIGAVRLDQESEFILSRGRGLSGGQTNLAWATVAAVQNQTNSQVTDIGYVAQQDLNFDDKLIASLGVRFDRSTLNADQDKFYAFPKASLAANLHNFDFWNIDFINQFKPRIAYGETGGLPNFGVTFESLSSQLIGGSLGGRVGTRAIDPNLVPETAQELEFGFDAGFLNNRLTFEATFYNKRVKDLIFDVTPPESTGITAIATNAGDLENRGFELGLGVTSVRSENLSVYSKLLFWRNVSELTRWDVNPQTVGGFGPSLGTYLFAEGFSPTTIVGTPSGTSLPLGFTEYGDRQPDFTMSLYNEINIAKNLDLSFLFHWQNGGNAINLSALLWDIGGTTPNWDGDDDGDDVPNGSDRLGEWGSGNTGVYIQETSYVKLREIGLYYTLPDNLFGEAIQKIKIGASANNVLLWTSYGSYDPEVSNFGAQPVSGNIEVTPFPSSRRLFFHLKVDF
ncbi:MAG: SusC/RagA family TonB-linked outer membrane protein [Bacteroidota bacterium]